MQSRVTRDYALLQDGAWKIWFGVPWPTYQGFQPQSWEITDYHRKYMLVCPECGDLWCKSHIYNSPIWQGEDWHSPRELSKWDIRIRHCERHLESFVGQELAWRGEFSSWQPGHCPGAVLSIAGSPHSDNPPFEFWPVLLDSLPPDLRARELRLWALLDDKLNPTGKEPPNELDSLLGLGARESIHPPGLSRL